MLCFGQKWKTYKGSDVKNQSVMHKLFPGATRAAGVWEGSAALAIMTMGRLGRDTNSVKPKWAISSWKRGPSRADPLAKICMIKL